MKKLICGAGAVLVTTILSSCGTAGQLGDYKDPNEEKVYVTGSNLPKRDRSSVTTLSKEAIENSAIGSGPSVTPVSR